MIKGNISVYFVPKADDEIEALVPWKYVLNVKKNGLQVWILKEYIRDPYSLFYSNRSNVARMDSILFNLIQEVYYDMHQMQFVSIGGHYQMAKK